MQTISHKEADLWFRERDFPEWRVRDSKQWHRFMNIEEQPAGRSMHFARSATVWLAKPEPRKTMVFVYDPHVWPSSENPHLFGVWRKQLGATAELDDSPGHLFEAAETDELCTLLHLSIIFGWGVVGGAEDPQIGVHIDNDGHVSAYAESSKGLPSVEWLREVLG